MYYKRFIAVATMLIFVLSSINHALAKDSLNSGKKLIIGLSGQVISVPQAVTYWNSKQNIEIRYVRAMAIPGYHMIAIDSSVSEAHVDTLIQYLKSDENVRSVEIDGSTRVQLQPNDPFYADGDQWGLLENGIAAEEAWDYATGAGINVAVLDTGIVPHKDLKNVAKGYDFITDLTSAGDGDGRDDSGFDSGDFRSADHCPKDKDKFETSSSWHGTQVASIIAAATNNAQMIAGVAFDATIVPIRVLGKCGGEDSDIAEAIIWAAGGSVSGVPANPTPAQVINLSFGDDPGKTCPGFLADAIKMAIDKGAVVVAATGNESGALTYPANCDGVIAVAAHNESGERASFSNFGDRTDLAAPGENVNVLFHSSDTHYDGNLLFPDLAGTNNGTSFSAPHVAGVAALLFHFDDIATPNDVKYAMIDGARPFAKGKCEGCGSGMLDAKGAIDAYLVRISGNACQVDNTTYPLCNNDNGGWGWENNQSCVSSSICRVIVEADLDNNNSQSSTDANNSDNSNSNGMSCDHHGTNYPLCSMDNGDWGWENNASCISESICASVVGDSAANNNTMCNWYGNNVPLCTTDNGDWGWENNASCISRSKCDSQ